MTRFCVNIGFLFTELPYLERFAAAREAGFEAVEFAWPTVPQDDVVGALREAGVGVAQMNMDAGDLVAGERGWASHPADVERWREAFRAALELAGRTECPSINVLAGNAPEGCGRNELEECLSENLSWALPQAAAARRVLLLEVLNATDTPHYLFTESARAAAFIRELGEPGLRLQLDTYHLAMNREEPAGKLRELAPLVGHVQVADAPGRHEPGTGRIDFPGFFGALTETRYEGAVGLEYLPSADTLSSLAWLGGTRRR
jgi:hydroxypyruvate isomerase